MKKLIVFFKFIFENAPNYVFWLSVLVFLKEWYLHQHFFIKTVFILTPIVSIIVLLKRTIKQVRSEISKSRIEKNLQVQKVQNKNKLKLLLKNVPTKKHLKLFYEYAENYAKLWASDGKLESICYYLELDDKKLSKSAQIFLRSLLRNEILTLYLPIKSQHIEEVNQNPHNKNIISSIYSFIHFEEAIKMSLENSAADIEKAVQIRLQVAPASNYLSINVGFEIDRRTWYKRYTLSNNKLMNENGNVLHEFE